MLQLSRSIGAQHQPGLGWQRAAVLATVRASRWPPFEPAARLGWRSSRMQKISILF